jgi:ATP-dependent RNA helicase DeaD
MTNGRGRPEEKGRAAAGSRNAPAGRDGQDEARRAATRREADKAEVDFRSLGLSPATMAAVERAGYEIPTPVQAGLIPRALQGIDVLGQARTGTG